MARRNKTKNDSGVPRISTEMRSRGTSILALDRISIIQALVILIAGLCVFWPAQHGEWLMDDSDYITNNPLLMQPDRLWKAWFKLGSFHEYYPLEQSVQWAQWQLWHTESFGYHLTSLILHLLSGLLVWRLLAKLGVRLAWLGGLIFTIHPMMVESVAYVSELKNTLSLPPFLLAMCAWIDFEEKKRRKDYLLVLALFLTAMLCKPSMALFPLMVLLYAWWKRGRVTSSDLKSSLPLFAISAILGGLTMLAGSWYAQTHPLFADDFPVHGFFSRLALVGLTFTFYFAKCFWPNPPMPYYPQWNVDGSSFWQYLPWLVWGGFVCWIWTQRKSWGRHVILGWGFFFLNLLPFLGWVNNHAMEASWANDHLLYIPIIGLIGLVVAALGQIGNEISAPMRYAGTGVIALGLIFLAYETASYATIFAQPIALWNYTLGYNPGSWAARNSVALLLLDKGRDAEAADQFENILRERPRLAPVHCNLGTALKHIGMVDEAEQHYQEAIELKPDYFEAHFNLANTLLQEGQTFQAIDEFQAAEKISPEIPQLHALLGNLLSLNDHPFEAVEEFRKALAISPNLEEVHNNLGVALQRTGRTSEAKEEFRRAVEINPAYEKARTNLLKLENAPVNN